MGCEHGDDPAAVTAMLATLSSTRRGRRAARRSPSSSGTGSRADSAISPARRRGGRAESANARTVLVRAARIAGTSDAASATASATVTTSPAADGPSGDLGRADQAGTRTGQQRSGQPPGYQPGHRREQRQDQVLGQQHRGDQPRRAADRLEQPDPPGLLRHPAADQHRHAGQREQPEQPATRQQDLLLVRHQQAVRGGDPLPRGQ